MISPQQVREVLYNFLMYAFGDFASKAKSVPLRKDAQDKILLLLSTADFLTAEEATMLPNKQKKALFDLIKWYISYLYYPEFPPFPSDFLFGSSERQLNKPLLRYMFQLSSVVLEPLP